MRIGYVIFADNFLGWFYLMVSYGYMKPFVSMRGEILCFHESDCGGLRQKQAFDVRFNYIIAC